MDTILIVEDSKLFASMLKKRIETELPFDTVLTRSLKETKDLLEGEHDPFFLALLDLNLPDAQSGEVVDYVLTKNIPSVVFTGEFDDHIRDSMWSKRVVDYVLKESSFNLDYIITLIQRIHRNQHITILVVDDSVTARKHMSELLGVHKYLVIEAENGVEALKLLKANPETKLVLTDYNMPHMDGFELTRKIRASHSKQELAVIGISALGNHVLSARFIKNGANDFITKPFLTEEFYSRITQNVEMIEYVERIKDLSFTDYLTGLHNRRYFFETAKTMFANVRRGNLNCTLAMIDIDDFKTINDTFGHDAGDAVLKHVAAILGNRFRKSDIVARTGGDEFSVFLSNMDPDKAGQVFEEVKQTIAETGADFSGATLKATVSIGISTNPGETLEDTVTEADKNLYLAKAEGKNGLAITG